MEILADPLPRQWRVVLDDGTVVGVWASAYGETDEHYTFEIMAEASLEEQADEDLVISGETPSNPRRFTFVVAQIPKHRVSDIVTASWENPSR